MFEEMNEKLASYGVIPVVVLNHSENALPLAQALIDGGLMCAEITFRTQAAEESIRLITEKYPEMLVGAGTVLTMDQLERALAAGAKFIVSPCFDPEIVDYCIEKGIPVYPGVQTPTEINQGFKRGLRLLKYFPAEQAGGVAGVTALCQVFRGLQLLPTGGVSLKNLREYLSCKYVAAVGGSWIVKADYTEKGEYDRITKLAKEAITVVREAREGA